MKEKINNITKSIKRPIVTITDILLIVIVFLIFNAYILAKIATGITLTEKYIVLCSNLLYYIIFQNIFKLNRCLWPFASGENYIRLTAVTLFVIAYTSITYSFIYGYKQWIVAASITHFLLLFFFMVVTRFIFKMYFIFKHKKEKKNTEVSSDKNTLIIGAGWTGNTIAKELINNSSVYYPVCFVDDDFNKQNMETQGIPIVGTTYDIAKVVKEYNIKKVIFAIPSCPSSVRSRILNDCIATNCKVKAVPFMHEIIEKADMLSQTRDIKIEDLLGREESPLECDNVEAYIKNKVCVVTGGGGSIGSELCRQIASFKPKKLVIVDIYENNAYDIQQELIRRYGKKLDLVVEISSIADYDKSKVIFERYNPQVIFHAAAHKHVPLMETVPEQAVKNNIVGTYNWCRLATEFKVDKFVLISTDKAVNPTNVMGASKRCCEMIVKCFSQKNSDTQFCAVRFGNVLGSNGSVIPLFKRQIEEGGPITITDKNIIRYFMTIPEAVSLVLQTGALSKNGEIFVLDMGEPVKILTLAENMIKLSGLQPYKDIDIKVIGLRPGEKLYEELLLQDEGIEETLTKKIFIGKQPDIDESVFVEQLDKLISAANKNNTEEVLEQLKIIVPTFNHKV